MGFILQYDQQVPKLSSKLKQKIKIKGDDLLKFLQKETKVISLLICSRQSIHDLNLKFRNKNKPTDILSWTWDSVTLEEFNTFLPWGEIAICFEICQEQANQFGWNFEKEFFRLLIHGVLHLTGLDHESSEEEANEMRQLEVLILNQLGYLNCYD